MRLEQIAAVMEGDLGGEGGPAASTIMAVADAARMWNAGKGGAYYAPGRSLGLVRSIWYSFIHHTISDWHLLSGKDVSTLAPPAETCAMQSSTGPLPFLTCSKALYRLFLVISWSNLDTFIMQ